MDHAGKATVMENLAGVRWTKLLFNVAASGMSTALGATGSQLMESDKAADAVIYIMIETILTARALGVDLAPMRGVDPGMLVDIARQDMANTRNLLRGLVGDFATAKASMLQDLEKGLPCEVESINGYLSAMAARGRRRGSRKRPGDTDHPRYPGRQAGVGILQPRPHRAAAAERLLPGLRPEGKRGVRAVGDKASRPGS